jgi:hypothetical protein
MQFCGWKDEIARNDIATRSETYGLIDERGVEDGDVIMGVRLA